MKKPAAKLLLLAALVGLAAVDVLKRPEDVQVARTALRPAEAPEPVPVAGRPAAPGRVAPEAEVARSMDETVLRQQVFAIFLDTEIGAEVATTLHDVFRGVIKVG